MTAATTTPAQVIDSFGEPDLLHADDRPLDAPGPGQVQVRVAAAGVNPVDLTTRAGKNIHGDAARFPMVIGWDAAGTVVKLGDGVKGWQVGDRVAAMTFQALDQNGTYAQFVNLDADLVAQVPDGLTLDQAATVPLVGLTGSQLVEWLDLPAGATLLVNGPVGAVGRVVVQLAHLAGIRVVAVAKPTSEPYARELGATEVVDRGDYTTEVRALYPEGVDAAIDLVGGAAGHAALASVRDGGAYVTVVPPYVDPTGPFDAERGIRFEVLIVHPDTTELTTLLKAAERGELSTAVEHAYPLDQAAEAHRRQAQGGLRGKLLLLP